MAVSLFDQIIWVNAISCQMIYEQPAIDEFRQISVLILPINGQMDRTAAGKNI